MKANEMQVGGKHYKTAMEHWDWVLATNQDYLLGNATKYISRWRKKGGLQDLQKGLHYVNKLIEVLPPRDRILNAWAMKALLDKVAEFSQINALTQTEQEILEELVTWQDEDDLIKARDMILLLMDEAQPPEPKPVPAEDSNRHAERFDPLEQGGISDRLSNFDDWGDRIRDRS